MERCPILEKEIKEASGPKMQSKNMCELCKGCEAFTVKHGIKACTYFKCILVRDGTEMNSILAEFRQRIIEIQSIADEGKDFPFCKNIANKNIAERKRLEFAWMDFQESKGILNILFQNERGENITDHIAKELYKLLESSDTIETLTELMRGAENV